MTYDFAIAQQDIADLCQNKGYKLSISPRQELADMYTITPNHGNAFELQRYGLTPCKTADKVVVRARSQMDRPLALGEFFGHPTSEQMLQKDAYFRLMDGVQSQWNVCHDGQHITGLYIRHAEVLIHDIKELEKILFVLNKKR